jgi:hypothetical protein
MCRQVSLYACCAVSVGMPGRRPGFNACEKFTRLNKARYSAAQEENRKITCFKSGETGQ